MECEGYDTKSKKKSFQINYKQNTTVKFNSYTIPVSGQMGPKKQNRKNG